MATKMFSVVFKNFYFFVVYFMMCLCDDNFCPSENYVSKIEFTKISSNDYKLAVECQPFQPSSNAFLAEAECVIREPFPLDGYNLLWEDYLKNCRCNEYLGGIRFYKDKWAASGSTVKLIQLRCCWSANKEQNPPSCVSSGMEYLQSPWGKSTMGVSKEELQSGHNYAIQSLVIKDGYMNARLCDYRVANNKGYTLPKSGIKSCWSGVDWDCTENQDTGRACNDKTTSMFGWNDELAYSNDNSVVSMKTYSDSKLLQFCRSGFSLSSVTKKAISWTNSKTYEFSIKCTPTTSRTCYCLWLPKCPTEEFFGTPALWYVSGLRTLWDTVDKKSKLEILCCHSHSLKMGSCKTENLKSDSQSTFNVAGSTSSVFPVKVQTALSVVTNVETFYDKEELNMRITVCQATYVNDWCYNDPCYWCRSRSYRDGASIPGAGYWSAQDAGATSSSFSSSNQVSDNSLADESYWRSWSGWSSWSGAWGNCGGLSMNTLWLGGTGRRGSWSSWNSWRRNNAYEDDNHYKGCSSCSRATVGGARWGKSWSSNNKGGWSSSGSSGSGSSGSNSGGRSRTTAWNSGGTSGSSSGSSGSSGSNGSSGGSSGSSGNSGSWTNKGHGDNGGSGSASHGSNKVKSRSHSHDRNHGRGGARQHGRKSSETHSGQNNKNTNQQQSTGENQGGRRGGFWGTSGSNGQSKGTNEQQSNSNRGSGGFWGSRGSNGQTKGKSNEHQSTGRNSGRSSSGSGGGGSSSGSKSSSAGSSAHSFGGGSGEHSFASLGGHSFGGTGGRSFGGTGGLFSSGSGNGGGRGSSSSGLSAGIGGGGSGGRGGGGGAGKGR